MMQKVFLGIGSNMGNKWENLALCRKLISENMGVVINKSSIYETEPWGVEGQESYYNQVLEIDTPLTPFQLLAEIQTIEQQMGRKRGNKWASRPIDIDILAFSQAIINQSDLTIPHPLLEHRKFVLLPLNEISPDWCHPVSKKTIENLIAACQDTTWVKKIDQNENLTGS